MRYTLCICLVLAGCSSDVERVAPIEKVPSKKSVQYRAAPRVDNMEHEYDDDVSEETQQDRPASKRIQVQDRIDRIARLKRSGKNLKQIKQEMETLKKERQGVTYDPLSDNDDEPED